MKKTYMRPTTGVEEMNVSRSLMITVHSDERDDFNEVRGFQYEEAPDEERNQEEPYNIWGEVW